MTSRPFSFGNLQALANLQSSIRFKMDSHSGFSHKVRIRVTCLHPPWDLSFVGLPQDLPAERSAPSVSAPGKLAWPDTSWLKHTWLVAATGAHFIRPSCVLFREIASFSRSSYLCPGSCRLQGRRCTGFLVLNSWGWNSTGRF